MGEKTKLTEGNMRGGLTHLQQAGCLLSEICHVVTGFRECQVTTDMVCLAGSMFHSLHGNTHARPIRLSP